MTKPKPFSSAPDHLRYNELLEYAQEEVFYVQELADRAYRIALYESCGPKTNLTKIAEAAANFVNAVKSAKSL